jgi:uncharacterized membrane protein YfhO
VLSELWLEGARAEVDGREASVVAADLALTGVFVPAGEHAVRITWTLPGLTLGALLSLASLLVAIAVWLRRGLP